MKEELSKETKGKLKEGKRSYSKESKDDIEEGKRN